MTKRIKRHRKLKAVDRNATDYCNQDYCNAIVLNSIFCLNWSMYWYCNIIISGKTWCAKNSLLYQEYRYSIEDRYIGVLSHTFYCNFCWDITYLSLYRNILYRNIEDGCIRVPLYLNFIHYDFFLTVHLVAFWAVKPSSPWPLTPVPPIPCIFILISIKLELLSLCWAL